MAFRVELSPRAFADLDTIAGYIRQADSLETAERWLNGVLRAIESLEQFSQRSPIAEESRDIGREIRVLLHGRKNRAYRIFYAVLMETQTVQVLHVRHWARQAPSSGEIEGLLEG
jgi:plasmid stabilization system protein ParE